MPTSETNEATRCYRAECPARRVRGARRRTARARCPRDQARAHQRRGARGVGSFRLAHARSAEHAVPGAGQRGASSSRWRRGFAPHHVANVTALARGGYFDGLAIVRAQDNYVVQWADPDAKKPVGAAQRTVSGGVRAAVARTHPRATAGSRTRTRRRSASSTASRQPPTRPLGRAWLVHCYGMVGAGRDNDVDSGGGTELYVVIGQAPRHLDRNVTLFGRVLEGMELLSVLAEGQRRARLLRAARASACRSSRCASPPTCRPRSARDLEVLRTDTATFRRTSTARRNRHGGMVQGAGRARRRVQRAGAGARRHAAAAAGGRAPASVGRCEGGGGGRGASMRAASAAPCPSSARARTVDHTADAARDWRCASARAASAAARAAAAGSWRKFCRTASRWVGLRDWKCCQRLRSAWRCSGGRACHRVKRSGPACAARATCRASAGCRARAPAAARAAGCSTARRAAEQLLLLRREARPVTGAAGAGGGRGRCSCASSGAAAMSSTPKSSERGVLFIVLRSGRGRRRRRRRRGLRRAGPPGAARRAPWRVPARCSRDRCRPGRRRRPETRGSSCPGRRCCCLVRVVGARRRGGECRQQPDRPARRAPPHQPLLSALPSVWSAAHS